MKKRKRKVSGLCLFLGLVFLVFTQSAQPESTRSRDSAAADKTSCRVTVQDGLLSVKARRISLPQVLEQIAAQAQFTIVIKGALEGPVTDEFSFLSVEQGIRRLIRGKNSVFVYAPRKEGKETVSRLAQITIFAASVGPVQASSAGSQAEFLGQQEPPSVPSSLMDDVQSEDPNVRIEAVETLRKIRGKQAAEAAVVGLRDEDAAVRRHATEALFEIGDKRAVKPLTRVLLNDQDRQVRMSAAEALVQVGDERAIEPLGAALRQEQDDPILRASVVDTLGEVGSPRAIGLLDLALGDDDPRVRMSAVDALELIGGKEIVPLLEKAAEDEDVEVRQSGERALSRLGEED